MAAPGERSGLPRAPEAYARQSEYNGGKSDPIIHSHQPPKGAKEEAPSACPQCGSNKLWRDGHRNTGRGRTQRWLCLSCGFRFSQSRADLKVEVDVSSEDLEKPHPGEDLLQADVLQGEGSVEPSVEDPPLALSEDIRSHDESYIPVVEKRLNGFRVHSRERRVCAEGIEAKNLANSVAQDIEALRGAVTIETAKIEDYLKDFADKQTTMGLNGKTIKDRTRALSLLHKRGADLFNPETVFRAIDHAKRFNHKTGQLKDEDWSDGSKNKAAQAYAAFCAIGRIHIPEHVNFDKWSRQPQKLPWIPLEREVDELIAGCNRRFGAFLQLLKETGVRSGEAWRLKLEDIDVERSVITFNMPEKGSNPRQHKVSLKLIAMLNSLPKKSQKVFGDGDLDQFRKCFMLQRKRIAHKLQNPRLDRITFHTLRHFYATMEYSKTKDILHVQNMLGHKSITSTMVYTHLVNFEGDEFHTATASTLKEDEDLLKAGFEYVTDRDGVKIYRKRK